MPITPADKRALKIIASTRVNVTNNGHVSGKGVTDERFKALRTAKLVDLNGASVAMIDGRPARRAVPTRAGWEAIK